MSIHGTKVTIPGDVAKGDAEVPAYAAIAPNAKRGMVVIHEIFGPAPDINGVVDRFAEHGYAAVAPNLFADGKFRCIRSVMAALKTGGDIAPIRAARATRDWLCKETGLQSVNVGIIGFCFGGGFALLAGPGFAAVSTNYGDIPEASVMKGMPPVIGCYGGRDVLFKAKGALLKKRLGEVGVTPEVHDFAAAGHAFLTNGNRPLIEALTAPLMHVKYNPAIAAEAWGKIDEFFERTIVAR